MTDSVDLVASLLDAGLTGQKVTANGADEKKQPVKEEEVKKESSRSSKSRERDRDRRKSRSRSRRRSRSRSRSSERRKRSRSRRSRSRSRGSRRRRSRSRDRRRRRSRSRSRSRDRHRRRRRSRSRSRDEGDFEKKHETDEERLIRDQIRDQCTVLVTMLPVKCTARDIATYFSQCGTVRDVRLIKDRGSRQHKGFSYVEFETPEEATGALRLTGALFQGRSLVVQPTHNEKNRAFQAKQAALAPLTGSNAPMKVYVGSLHFNVTEVALRSIFQPFGPLTEVVLHRDPETKQSRGFGFVTFASPHDAKRAMSELNGLEILGRPMKVGECKENSSGLEPSLGTDDMAPGDRLENDDALVLNQATRSLLMAKLQRGRDAGGVADGGLLPTPGSSAPVADQLQQSGVVVSPSRCLVIENAFNAAEEDARPDNANWEREIEDDVRMECSAYGPIDHIKLEKASGCIYLKYGDIQHAMAAKNALNGRFFGGQTIAVEFVTNAVYHKKYGV